jgi:uncharacterized membrane protein
MGEATETVAQVVTMLLAIAGFFRVNHYEQLGESNIGRFVRRTLKWILLGVVIGTMLWILAPERFNWFQVVFPFTVVTLILLLFSELGRFVLKDSVVLSVLCACVAGAAVGILLRVGPFGTGLFSAYGLIGGAFVAISERRASSSRSTERSAYV